MKLRKETGPAGNSTLPCWGRCTQNDFRAAQIAGAAGVAGCRVLSSMCSTTSYSTVPALCRRIAARFSAYGRDLDPTTLAEAIALFRALAK